MNLFLVDTNIISERMRPQPNPNVVQWLEKHASELYLSAITIEELWYGVQNMPEGKRKQGYRSIVKGIVSQYPQKILRFGSTEALLSAEFRHKAKMSGYTTGVQDMMIAAIAKSNGMMLATRNIKDFSFLEIGIVNPFESHI